MLSETLLVWLMLPYTWVLKEPDYWAIWMEQVRWKGLPDIPGC